MHGQELGAYAYGMWLVVAFNVALVLFFTLSFVRPKRAADWRSMRVLVGFIVALFTEMYGVPLTIYFLSQWLGHAYPVLDPFTHAHGHLWLVALGLADSAIAMTLLHVISNGVILLGFYLVYRGWKLIHAGAGRLVTGGIYARMRHPQYTGLFLITLGFLIQWPTLVTLLMWPVLLLAYHRLARREEAEVSAQFPDAYAQYREQVPAYLPRFRRPPARPLRRESDPARRAPESRKNRAPIPSAEMIAQTRARPPAGGSCRPPAVTATSGFRS